MYRLAVTRPDLWRCSTNTPCSSRTGRATTTYGQVLADQIKGANAAEIDASEDEANRERLY